MSITSEINRLSGNVSDALDAIEAKGVTVPSGSNSDDLADLISQIQTTEGINPRAYDWSTGGTTTWPLGWRNGSWQTSDGSGTTTQTSRMRTVSKINFGSDVRQIIVEAPEGFSARASEYYADGTYTGLNYGVSDGTGDRMVVVTIPPGSSDHLFAFSMGAFPNGDVVDYINADFISSIKCVLVNRSGIGVVVVDQADANGGTTKNIYGVDLSNDTVDAGHLATGYTAHDSLGRPIVGTYSGGGGGEAIAITDTTDSHGGTIREITAVSLAGDTVTPEVLLSGYTAHDASGQAIIGTASSGIDDITIDLESAVVNSHLVDPSNEWNSNTSNSASGGVVEIPDGTKKITVSYIDGSVVAILKNVDNRGTNHATPAFSDAYPSRTKYTGQGQASFLINPEDHYLYFAVTTTAGVDIAIVSAVCSASVRFQSKTNITPTESSQTIAADTGYDGFSSVQINGISSSYVGSDIARKSSSDLTASGATVTVPAGYYEAQATKAVSNGSATAPASISGTAATVSTGTNTLTLTKSVSVTPSVTAGYVSSGTAGNSDVSLTASVTTKAAATITPTTSTQTIAAGTYLTGAQTIGAIPSQYVVPSGNKEITANGTGIDVAQFATVSVNVPGKAAQIAPGFGRVASTTYTEVSGQTITVGKTGTYDVYWVGYRSSTSGTNGSQLYIGSTAHTSGAQTTFDATYTNWQIVHLSNVSLTAGDIIAVRARSRTASYYMYVANFTIIEA